MAAATASLVRHRFTDRGDGDLSGPLDDDRLVGPVGALGPRPWTWVRQVHGAEVVVVEAPGHHAGVEADAIVTAVAGATLAVRTADCGALLLDGNDVVGVVHAGWRGLQAGVVEAAASAMGRLGGPPQRAVLGPTIRPRCYEFAGPELDGLAARFGDRVRSTTAWGTPALDLGAAIGGACEQIGVPVVDAGICTACSPVHWSHRAGHDAERQALVAWIEP